MQALITCGIPNLIIRNLNTDLAISRSSVLIRLLVQQSIIALPIIFILMKIASIDFYLLISIYIISLGNFFLLIMRLYFKLGIKEICSIVKRDPDSKL